MKTEEDTLAQIDKARARRPHLSDETVTLAHGAGGKASAALIDAVFIDVFGSPTPGELTDGALLGVEAGCIAYSTDSYVVNPIRFPGSSIGELAVNGTVNDLAVSGAQPRWLSAAFIVEEGFPIADLRGIVEDMKAAADKARVAIVTGDTKVVPRGSADKVFITTSGIGVVLPDRHLGARHVTKGDTVILSGPIAAHGMAVMLARGDLALSSADIQSDSAPINGLVEAMYAAVDASSIHWMRDATRGGLGTVMNELATDCGLAVLLNDEVIPVDDAVRGACDMLGIDPLYVANEGCFVAVVEAGAADAIVEALHAAGAGRAVAIGDMTDEFDSVVAIRNAFGGTRLVDMLVGDPLPRIC